MSEESVKKAVENLLKKLQDGMLSADAALKYSQALANLSNATIGFKSTKLLDR